MALWVHFDHRMNVAESKRPPALTERKEEPPQSSFPPPVFDIMNYLVRGWHTRPFYALLLAGCADGRQDATDGQKCLWQQ